MIIINMKDLLTKKAYVQKDPFWYEEPSILIRKDRLDEFYPSRNMTLVEQLNSIIRLFMYVSLLLIIFKRNINYLFLLVSIMILSYIIYYYSDEKNPVVEKFLGEDRVLSDKDIVKPTIDNPFMNVLLTDYTDNPNRESLNKVNNYDNQKLNKEVDDKFYYNLYRDVDDVYDKYNSQRQFYTMPSTTIPNEQGRFVNWLYNVPPTCKEGNGYRCYGNIYNELKDSKYRNQFFV